MSVPKIRKALETALAAMSPALATAWENASYTPAVGVPYQEPTLVPGPIANDEYGRAFQQGGFFQVALRWPSGQGTADIGARAELIRSTFYKGLTLVADGQPVQVVQVPGIGPGFIADDGRYVVVVTIYFLANLQN